VNPISIASPDLPSSSALGERLLEVLESRELTNAGEVAAFEREAAEALEAPECVAVSSCTAGLMLVERCLGLRGEVITPSFTFFATAHGLLWNNLRPVFADCDASSFQIDPASVERALSRRTSAILAVHMFGAPAPVDELERLARRAGVALIFDGAHALGTRFDGKSVADCGDATVYSLSPTKQLTCGEGGLIVTRHKGLAKLLRQARNYGKGETYDCEILGLNARMSELQAALGRADLPRLHAKIRRRNEIAAIYESRLKGLPGLRLQRTPHGAVHSRKDFGFVLGQGLSRDALSRALAEQGIDTRPYFYPPLHRQKLYSRFYRPRVEALRATDAVSRSILCLPIHTRMTDADAVRVACAVAEHVCAPRAVAEEPAYAAV
jgi:dTDP-4-amino-4,6-dideoxygalactose transaminase